MSKRAEERALEAYPIEICGYVTECRVGAKPQPQDWNEERRKCFQEGYEQAEKDLALTWEDMAMINTFGSEVIGEHLFDNWTEQQIYTEVLTRFKQIKEVKK